MIGLWGPGTAYGKQSEKGHIAFAVSLDELFAVIKKLNQRGIETVGFGGEKTNEPTVIGWMPSAQIYFRDPDGHMLEFITILPNPPNRSFNGPYSEWKGLSSSRNAHRHNQVGGREKEDAQPTASGIAINDSLVEAQRDELTQAFWRMVPANAVPEPPLCTYEIGNCLDDRNGPHYGSQQRYWIASGERIRQTQTSLGARRSGRI